jgi:hypothetical protein
MYNKDVKLAGDSLTKELSRATHVWSEGDGLEVAKGWQVDG